MRVEALEPSNRDNTHESFTRDRVLRLTTLYEIPTQPQLHDVATTSSSDHLGVDGLSPTGVSSHSSSTSRISM